ncbi:MAG TPA: zinc ribbon domain-containing protein [Polyangiaceae bacterium]|nr:zinc ribbon domain-containing protein [Polyangiaceae bacterium]
MTTQVYRYGIATPHERLDVVLDQMRLAHEYARNLVLIERGRRWAEREIRRASSEALRQLEDALAVSDARVEALVAGMRAARAKARKRVETPEQRATLKAAREETKRRRDALYEMRRNLQAQCADCRKAKSEAVPCSHASPEAVALRNKLDLLDAEARELQKNARNHSGLFWGTYLIVDRAARASFAAPLYEPDGFTPHDPPLPPPRWAGEGAVAVQIQSTRPLTVKGLLTGKDSRVGMTSPPWPEEWLAVQPPIAPPGSAKMPTVGYKPDGVTRAPIMRADGTPARWVRDRAARHGELRMRVGVNDETTTCRVDYHRPLPANATISWVAIYRRMRGPHPEWSVCVTLENEQTVATSPRSGIVALDVGWRLMPDGSLRVAAWSDDVGQRGELRLSPADIRALRQHEEIQSARDLAFDAVRARFKHWASTATDIPEWLAEAGRFVHAWRNPARMVSLLHRWMKERPEVSAEESKARDAVAAWADRDRHEWATVESRRMWGLRRRKDKYRCFAKQMAKTYGTIVLENFDLRKMAEHKPVGEDSTENETARSNRHMAAVGYLREYIKVTAAREGAKMVLVSAVDSTRICPSCGLVADRDAAAQVRLTCECGHTWDQDVDGAAPILLNRYRERPNDAKIVVGARNEDNAAGAKEKGADRWARARRMGAAKKARIAAAREASDSSAE